MLEEVIGGSLALALLPVEDEEIATGGEAKLARRCWRLLGPAARAEKSLSTSLLSAMPTAAIQRRRLSMVSCLYVSFFLRWAATASSTADFCHRRLVVTALSMTLRLPLMTRCLDVSCEVEEVMAVWPCRREAGQTLWRRLALVVGGGQWACTYEGGEPEHEYVSDMAVK